MTPLPPHLDRLHEELMTAARVRAATPRRRPTRRLAAVVAFAMLATAGATLAATATNPFDWLRGGDPQRDLRVTPDESRRVDGDVPRRVMCPPAVDVRTVDCRGEPEPECTTTTMPNGGEIETCASTVPAGEAPPGAAAGDRRYDLLSRVTERPRLTPDLLRSALAGRRPDEVLFPDAPARYRLTVGRVLELADRAPEGFWRGLDLLLSVQGGTVSAGDGDFPGMERVPPRGVRRFITCVDDGRLRCRATTNGESLPVGAPMYTLVPDGTWRSVPRPATADDDWRERERQAFGRDLTADEQALVAAMLIPLRGGGGDGSGGATAPAQPPAPEPVTEVTPAPAP